MPGHTTGRHTSSGTAQIPSRAKARPSRGEAVTTANGTASISGPQNSSAHSRAGSGASVQTAAHYHRAEQGLRPQSPNRLAPRQRARVAQLGLPADRPAGQAGRAGEQRLRDRHDRCQDEGEQQLDHGRDRDAPAAAIGAAQRRREQHLGDARELGGEHDQQSWSRSSAQPSHGGRCPHQTGDCHRRRGGERRPRSRGRSPPARTRSRPGRTRTSGSPATS